MSSEKPEQLKNVTVVIPTHRKEPVGLERFLEQAEQVWILNNGAVPISPKYIDRVSNIPVLWKGHGQTRQEIVSQVKTEFLFFSVDDATPTKGMLKSLIQTMNTQDCDAVIARQIPYPEASPVTIIALENWTPKQKRPYLMPQADHVGTLYRTVLLKRFPLPSVPIAEDAWWSIDKKILCDPNAVIVHSHARKTKDLFLRELRTHRELKKMGRKKASLSIGSALRGIFANARKYGYREGIRTSAEISARRIAWR